MVVKEIKFNNETIKRFPRQEITVKDIIRYVETTPNWGRAEFSFCPVYRDGFLKKLYIDRRQQGDPTSFVIDVEKSGLEITTFMFESWTQKTTPPRVWTSWYCKEHETIAQEVYVPTDTDCIVFHYHLGYQMSIRFEKFTDPKSDLL